MTAGRQPMAGRAVDRPGLPVLGHRQQPFSAPQPAQPPADRRRQGPRGGPADAGRGPSARAPHSVRLDECRPARHRQPWAMACRSGSTWWPWLPLAPPGKPMGSPLSPSLLLAAAAMATGTAMPNVITSIATSTPLSTAMRITFIPTNRRISRTSSLASPSGTAIATAMTRWPTSTPTSATCTTDISTEPSALPTPQNRINGQHPAGDFQSLVGALPAGRAEAQHLTAVAQPALLWGQGDTR